MQIDIKATNIELTPEIKDYVQKKMDMLDKYLGNFKVISARVEVDKTTKHHLKGEIYAAEINLMVNGDLLRVVKTEKELFKAIDKVKDHMELIIKKYKGKIMDRKTKKVKLSTLKDF